LLAANAPKRGFMAAVRRHMADQKLQLGYGMRSKQQGLTVVDA
jgi:hypothetical protein